MKNILWKILRVYATLSVIFMFSIGLYMTFKEPNLLLKYVQSIFMLGTFILSLLIFKYLKENGEEEVKLAEAAEYTRKFIKSLPDDLVDEDLGSGL